MEQKQLILLASSDINYDQRLQKIAQALHTDDWQVLLLGVKRIHSIPLKEKAFGQRRVKRIFSSGILFYLEFNCRFFWYLLRSKVDVLVANDPDTLPAVWLLSWFKRFDLVYDSHEYFTEVPELANKSFKRKVWAGLERWGVRKAKICYTVNESLAQILGKKYDKQFAIIRNVPLAFTERPPMNKKPYVLYQGALNKGRGLEVLIEAMQGVPLELWIAGKGDLEAELKQLVEQKKMTDQVKFLGMLLPNELRAITIEAKIGINVLASTSLNYYYSLANKCFDYMHAGVPAIHMNFPEYERIQEKAPIGVLIKELEVGELRKAILKLEQDEVYYQSCAENALRLAEEYQWDKEQVTLQNLFKALK